MNKLFVVALFFAFFVAIEAFPKAAVKPATPSPCEACEAVLGLLESSGLLNNATATEIEQDIALACKFIPVKYQPQCSNVVAVADQIINAVESDTQPSQICTTVGLC